MSARAAYPNAAIYPHGALTATQLEQLCRDHHLRLMQTTRGYLYLDPAQPQALATVTRGTSDLPAEGAIPAAAAGPT